MVIASRPLKDMRMLSETWSLTLVSVIPCSCLSRCNSFSDDLVFLPCSNVVNFLHLGITDVWHLGINQLQPDQSPPFQTDGGKSDRRRGGVCVSSVAPGALALQPGAPRVAPYVTFLRGIYPKDLASEGRQRCLAPPLKNWWHRKKYPKWHSLCHV